MSEIVIVTGAAGFIGSGVVRRLNDQGFTQLILVDDLGSDVRWKNLVGKKFLDILHIDQLLPYLSSRHVDVKAVFHLGAVSATTETDAEWILNRNYRYTKKLCQWCLQHHTRFIYASSAATYGDGSRGFSDAHEGLEQLEPLNMYGYSKHLFDLWAYREGVLDSIVGLKYFNVYGPNEYHKGRMSSVVPKFVEAMGRDGYIELFESSEPQTYEDGGQLRDFIYVKDAVDVTVRCMEMSGGGIFNVGTGQAASWNQLAKATCDALHLPTNIRYIPMPQDLVGTYQNFTQAQMSKLATVMDFTPTPLDKAVKEYVQNYLLQKRRW